MDVTLKNKMPFTCRFNELVISPKGKGVAVTGGFQLSARCTQLLAQRGDAEDKEAGLLPVLGGVVT